MKKIDGQCVISVRTALFAGIAAVIIPFTAGLIAGIVMGDDARQTIALKMVISEMKDGIKAGVPFTLKGSDIRLIPRTRKAAHIQIAGAGDQGMRKVGEGK